MTGAGLPDAEGAKGTQRTQKNDRSAFFGCPFCVPSAPSASGNPGPRNFVQDAATSTAHTRPMHFSHHPTIWSRFPELAAGALRADGLHRNADVRSHVARFHAQARERLVAVESESELPEIQAWRRVFARMNLKPTQYRCASESLLRRLRKEGDIPAIHPLVDLCNAASMAWAIPVAAIDLQHVTGSLQVRPATGSEAYFTFGGETEHPDPDEVTFVDEANRSHARRWTNRQSGLSAVRDATSSVLIVCEGVHATASRDVAQLVDALAAALRATWAVEVRSALLTAAAPAMPF